MATATEHRAEIDRIKGGVTNALTELANKGVTVPSGAGVDDLATLISAIESGGGVKIEWIEYIPASNISLKNGEIEIGETTITNPVLMGLWNQSRNSSSYNVLSSISMNPPYTTENGVHTSLYGSSTSSYTYHSYAGGGYFNSEYWNGLRVIDGKVLFNIYSGSTSDYYKKFYSSNVYHCVIVGE